MRLFYWSGTSAPVDTVISFARLFVGLIYIGILVALGIVLLIPIVFWHTKRIRLTNALGTWIGKGIMFISGCPVSVSGQEFVSADRPAIYAGNHTSIFDAFTSIWLSPSGTVGVAKREIIYYPFYGLAWVLAGHLLLDRKTPERARASMNKLSAFLKKERLHVFMYPEGSRARDGRLLPFKKGVIHLALQTGLPIVPVVTEGAHKAWEKATLALRKVPITVRFLEPIDTSGWTEDRREEHLADLRQRFIDVLPPAQRPLPADDKAALAA